MNSMTIPTIHEIDKRDSVLWHFFFFVFFFHKKKNFLEFSIHSHSKLC
uniref:Uncharacterized protein n=1 Tax=viral metagenome TaxID=1070528 RepID=A0A6C0K3G3_9ZZZZ